MIYNKTAYVQSKVYTPVLKNFTRPLVAMVVTFSMSGGPQYARCLCFYFLIKTFQLFCCTANYRLFQSD